MAQPIATLLQIFHRPWLMEPIMAGQYADIAGQVLYAGGAWEALAPQRSSRGNRYRVNAQGVETDDGPVMVIELNGPLTKRGFCGDGGMEQVQQLFAEANADPSIAGILLRVDSPGGTVDGTHNLARTVRSSAKTVVTHVNGMMCSAAYWVGSAAREIIADDANAGHNSRIGSIGTAMMAVDDRGADQQRGIKTIQLYATRSKRKGQRQQEVLDGKYDRVVAELDALNDTFISSVEEYRAGKLKPRMEDVFEGDTYNALDAQRFGLIDKIGTFGYAVKRTLQLSKTIQK